MSTAEFHAFESYPYDQDAEYRLGLNSILQHAQDEVHAQQLEKQARCFYFKRKTGKEVDLNAYNSWKVTQSKGKAPAKCSIDPASSLIVCEEDGAVEPKKQTAIEESIASTTVLSTTAGGDDADAKLSYQQIVEIIKSGKENDLPGIKDIPNTVLEGQGTASTQAQRKKPWEKHESVEKLQSPGACVELSASQ